MKTQTSLTKKDLIVALGCIIFLLANIAAIGPGGRRHALQTVCLSRLQKWGQIFQAYTADNDGYFHGREIGAPVGSQKLWYQVYEPYYNDRVMLRCPTAEDPDYVGGTFGTWDPYLMPDLGDYYGSYGINRHIPNITGGYSEDDAMYWRRAGVKGADKIPVLLDCQYVAFWPNNNEDPPMFEPPLYGGGVSNSMSAVCINRHDGFVNGVFLDFSARKIGLKQLWTFKWHRTADTCGPWTICGFGGNKAACEAAWDDQAPWMSDFPEY